MQCCGDPFEVDGTVRWWLQPVQDDDYLRQVLGDLATSVTHAEEHHSEKLERADRTEATVVAIRAVHCRFSTPAGSTDRMRYPVEGSLNLRQVDTADGWEPEDDDSQFVSYVVDLEQA
jgi:hypothetical protein